MANRKVLFRSNGSVNEASPSADVILTTGIARSSAGTLSLDPAGSGGFVNVSQGGFQIGGTTVFESDRDLAIDLIPFDDATRGIGTSSRRFGSVNAQLHRVFFASGDTQPSAQLTNTALQFGPGGSTAPDVQIFRGAADRLDLASGDSLNLILGSLQVAGTTVISSGRRVTPSAGATLPGLNVGTVSGDPSGPVNGDVWYNTSTEKFRAREAGVTVDLIQGASASGWTDDGAVVRLVTATDNVSIGTTSNLAKLAVVADTDEPLFRIRSITGQSSDIAYIDNDSLAQILRIGHPNAIFEWGAGVAEARLTAVDAPDAVSGVPFIIYTGMGGDATGAAGAGSGGNLTLFTGDGGSSTTAFPPAGSGHILLNVGTGGSGNASVAGATGGNIQLTAGSGGAGSASFNAGAGGNVLITAGSAGAPNGGAGASGGIIQLNAGNASGSGLAGTISLNAGSGTGAQIILSAGSGDIILNSDVNLAGGLEINSVPVFESDRDVAINLVPNANNSLSLGSATGPRYWSILYLGTSLEMGGQEIITSSGRVTARSTSTLPGLSVGSFAGDPSALTNGDIWYNSSTEKFRAYENGVAVNLIGSGTASGWQDDGTVVRLSTTTDAVNVGGTTDLGKLTVQGDTDEIQLRVRGNGTQTSNLVRFETSTPTTVWSLTNAGNTDQAGTLAIGGTTLFEADRDLAVTLLPNADGTLNLGSASRRFGSLFLTPSSLQVLAAGGDANPVVKVGSASIEFGAGGGTATDTIFSRGAANRLDLANGDSLILVPGGPANSGGLGVCTTSFPNSERVRITSGTTGNPLSVERQQTGLQTTIRTENPNASVGTGTSIDFVARNSGSADVIYGKLHQEITSATASTESGEVTLSAISAGTLTEYLTIFGGADQVVFRSRLGGGINTILDSNGLNVFTGSFQIASTTVFENDRDLAINLVPSSDNVRTLGTTSRRFSNVIASSHDVYLSAGDANPTARLSNLTLSLGAGGASLFDVSLQRSGAGTLAFTPGASASAVPLLSIQHTLGSTSTVTDHLQIIRQASGSPTAGIGVGRSIIMARTSGNSEAFREEVTYTDVAINATSQVVFKNLVVGAATNFLVGGASVDIASSGITTNVLGRLTTTSTSTLPAIRVGNVTSDPSTLANGDVWYNSTTGKFRARENGATVDLISASAASGWQDDGTIVRLSTTLDNVNIGGTTNLAKLAVQGDTDELQLVVRANSTQTNRLLEIQDSAGTRQLAIDSAYDLAFAQNFQVTGETPSTTGATGFTLTLNASNGGASASGVPGGAGGAASLNAGDGAAAQDLASANAGNGGSLTLTSGDGGNGNTGTNPHGGGTGATIFINAGSGGSGNTTFQPGAGGAISISSGSAGSAGGGVGNSGGAITITSGQPSGTSFASGAITIQTGNSGSSSVGALSILGGSGTAGNVAGGVITITGGSGTSQGSGGGVTIDGGTRGGTAPSVNGAISIGTSRAQAITLGSNNINAQGTGQSFIIRTPEGGGTTGGANGGPLQITLGDGLDASASTFSAGGGGGVTITCGTGGNGATGFTGSTGGGFTLNAGNGGTGSATTAAGAGGSIAINAGAGGGNAGGGGASGGNVSINAGTGSTTSGSIVIGQICSSVFLGNVGINTQIQGLLLTTVQGTQAALRVGAINADPSSLSNGDMWYNSTTGKFRARENGSSVDMITSAASIGWQDDGTVVRLVTTTDNVNIGGTTDLGKLAITGDTDEVQLNIRANAAQGSNLIEIENSAGSLLARWTATNIVDLNNTAGDANPATRLTTASLTFGLGGASALDSRIRRTAAATFTFDNNSTTGATLVPATDNTGSIGTNALRWSLVRAATVTGGDFELESHMAKWTVREAKENGEDPDALYAINRRTGKKFKLMLEEVS